MTPEPRSEESEPEGAKPEEATPDEETPRDGAPQEEMSQGVTPQEIQREDTALARPPPEKWWVAFRRPLTWAVIVGFAIGNAVVMSLGIPELWETLLSALLLAVAVAIVLRSKAPWAPLVVFTAVLTTRAVYRLGGLTGFLVFEAVLLLVAILPWTRKVPKPL